MSRFADIEGTRAVDLGDCQCGPASNHPRDIVNIRNELGYGALAEVTRASVLPEGGWSNFEGKIRLLRLSIVSWNLLGPDGKEVEVSEAAIRRLDQGTVERLGDAADATLKKGDPLPNASDAPSATSSPVSASDDPTISPIPTTPTPATPTTPS